MNVVPSTHICG